MVSKISNVVWCMEVEVLISREMQLALAKAVAKPRTSAQFIDETNKAVLNPVSIRRAYAVIDRDGYTFSVVPDDDLIPIDHDDPRKENELHSWLHEANELGTEPVLLTSGQPGHYHAWIRVEDPVIRQLLITSAQERGLTLRVGQRMRPPLAPHRNRLPVELIEPTDPAEALRRLTRTTPRSTGKFGSKVEALLVSGDTEKRFPHPDGRWADRSRVVWWIYMHSVRREVDPDYAFSRLRSPAVHPDAARLVCHRSGEPKSEVEARKEFDRLWKAAEVRVRGRLGDTVHDPSILQQIDEIEIASRLTLRGRSAQTDKRVLDTLLSLGRETHRLQVGASDRWLASTAGIHRRNTLPRSIRRLREAGFIEILSLGHDEDGTLYDLRLPPGDPNRLITMPSGELGGVPVIGIVMRRAGSILFARSVRGRKGLGPAAGELLDAIARAGRPISLSEVVKDPLLSSSRATLYRAVEGLRAWKLVIEQDGLLSLPEDVDERIRAAENEKDLPEAVAELHAIHEQDRNNYREWLSNGQDRVEREYNRIRTLEAKVRERDLIEEEQLARWPQRDDRQAVEPRASTRLDRGGERPRDAFARPDLTRPTITHYDQSWRG